MPLRDRSDRVFVPFNFTTVAPFDALASALAELPTPQISEPLAAAEAYVDHAFPSDAPTRAVQAEMLHLLCETADEGEWGGLASDAERAGSDNSTSALHEQESPWAAHFCKQLSIKLDHQQKRSGSPMRPAAKRATPKRPRHAPIMRSMVDENPENSRHGRVRAATDYKSRPSSHEVAADATRAEATEEESHSRELHLRKIAEDIDLDEFNDFVGYLEKFLRKPRPHGQVLEPGNAETTLRATSNLSLLSELRERVVLCSNRGVLRYVSPALLSGVIRILEVRIVESIGRCSEAPDMDSAANGTTNDGVLGVLAALTALSILCAPHSPRVLMVEELLDSIVRLLRTVSSNLVYPSRDPLYTSPWSTSGGKYVVTALKGKQSPNLNLVGEPKKRGKRSERPRAMRHESTKQDELLMDSCCALYDLLTALFLKEHRLPDSVVSLCSSVCMSSLSVTGIARLQLHAVKALSAVFSSYMTHRLTILDEVREAICYIPANRRHLRAYRVPGEDFEVRVTTALLSRLLCLASTDNEETQSLKANGLSQSAELCRWAALRQKRHTRAAKSAAHVLDPLLNRLYADRDPEFRAAFQALLDDALSLYGRPEWPSAELMLQTFSVKVITDLREPVEKSVFLKSVSVDILGALAARMCHLYGNGILDEKSFDVNDKEEVTKLEQEREQILLYLNLDRSSHSNAAMQFYEALFVNDDQGLVAPLRGGAERSTSDGDCKDSAHGIGDSDARDVGVDPEEQICPDVGEKASRRLSRISKRLALKESVSRTRALHAARFVGMNRNFAWGFRTILYAILDGMHDSAPTVRAKSIRALSVVDESCSGILRVIPTVLTYIEASCRDISILARDAALDLLSRSLLPRKTPITVGPALASTSTPRSLDLPHDEAGIFENVFKIVIKRLCDTATSVRKRAIAILRSVLSDALKQCDVCKRGQIKSIDTTDNARLYEQRIATICTNVIGRLDDPEASVRESAEKTLRLGLFGFDANNAAGSYKALSTDVAGVLAERLVTVFAGLPNHIHASVMHRVVNKATLCKHWPLLSAMVTASVDQLHEYEAKLANAHAGKGVKDMPCHLLETVKTLSVRRVACSSLLSAFTDLDPSLIAPHCRALAPSIKGVFESGATESDLLCAQRILKVLEVGLGQAGDLDTGFLEEVMHDVEVIVCQSPISVLEEASVRCLCVVAKKTNTPEAEDLVQRAANNFMNFLQEQRLNLAEYCQRPPDRPLGLERNAKGALVRLGLLTRFANFDASFVSKAYDTLEACCRAVCVESRKDILARASIHALSHFLIRHRSFLTKGTMVLLAAMDSCLQIGPGAQDQPDTGQGQQFCGRRKLSSRTADGIQFCILQGFHELLRDEEERNSGGKDVSCTGVEERPTSVVAGDPRIIPDAQCEEAALTGNEKRANQLSRPVLAAEEDAEAGYLALSAQAMIPRLKEAVHSESSAVRRTVANILGLLVRQGLVLPATVVPSLFSLLLDKDARCREHSFRVVSFLADRHSGMLSSAASTGMRLCFESSFFVHYSCRPFVENVPCGICSGHRPHGCVHTAPAGSFEVSVERIQRMSLDDKTGYSLLSQALMAMRRDQRRGLLEGLVREFDPRVSVRIRSPTENSTDTQLHEDDVYPAYCRKAASVDQATLKGPMDDDDDDVGRVSGAEVDLVTSENLCPLATLYFLAITLANIDYTNGAGIGGSLTQGGGTAAADTKLRYAKEDVSDLVSVATRIISNSGQATLRVAKQIFNKDSTSARKKRTLVLCASRISLLLLLKQHLKVVRWRPVLEVEDESGEAVDISVLAASRMPAFCPGDGALNVLSSVTTGGDDEGNKCIESQLQLFEKLMREDAIDERDMATLSRRTRGGMTSGRRKAGSNIGGSKRSRRKEKLRATPILRRQKSRRASSEKAARKLRYDDGSDGGASEFDPDAAV